MNHIHFARVLILLTTLAALSAAARAEAQTILRVNDDSGCTSGCDGSTWELAYPLLQDAIAAANPAPGETVQIWVAAGTYRPATTGFPLRTGVELYGGFDPVLAPSFAERDPDAYTTTLSGDRDASGSHTAGDAAPVVSVVGSGVLDGFAVRFGYAPSYHGAGIRCEESTPANAPILRNLVVESNRTDGGGGAGLFTFACDATLTNVEFSGNSAHLNGGGAYFYAGTVSFEDVRFVTNEVRSQSGGGLFAQSTTLSGDATFIGNAAYGGGGGLYCYQSTVSMNDAVFFGNTAGDAGGGGLRVVDCAAVLTNPLFVGNGTTILGGGVSVESGPLTLTNATLVGNVTSSTTLTGGGGIALRPYGSQPSTVTLNNTILWGNDGLGTDLARDQIDVLSGATFNNVILQGGAVTAEVSNADPLFVDASLPAGADDVLGTPDDGLALQSASPAIDAGDDTVVGVTTDLPGLPRFSGAAVDLGAYEYQQGTPSLPVLRVKPGTECGAACDGSTWDLAYPELRDALVAAGEPLAGETVQIWVAAGTYLPGTLVADSFELKPGVDVYGGFAGTESALTGRDFAANVTTLSGDLDGDGLDWGDAEHVVTALGDGVLDGFTITGGYGGGESGGGGGIYCVASPTLANLVIAGNYADTGGGLYNVGGSPTLRDVVFTLNAARGGAGMATQNGDPSLVGVRFVSNSADSQGGGLFVFSGTLELTDVAFSGNSADEGAGVYVQGDTTTLNGAVITGNAGNWSGGIGVSGSALVVLNGATVSGNSATLGGGGAFLAGDGSLTANNSIFWGNGSVQIGMDEEMWGGTLTKNYTIVEGSSAPDLTGDPRFANASDPDGLDDLFGTPDDGLQLTANSAAIDAGSNSLMPAGTTTDFAGQPRPKDDTGIADSGEGTAPIVDLGAYEFQGTSSTGNNAPVITSVTNDGPVYEGSVVTISVIATDADASDVLVYSYDCFHTGTFEADPQCTFLDDGVYPVDVKVSDGTAEVTGSTDVTVLNVAPVVDAGADVTIAVGDTFTRSGSFADPGTDVWNATVDYGDGTVGPLALQMWSFTLSHTYAAAGIYTVTVTVSDDDGGSDSDEAVVTVTEVSAEVANLRVSVRDAPDPVKVGEELSYAIEVINNGPDPAGGVVLELTLPAGLAGVVVKPVAGWTCETLGDVVTCTKAAPMLRRQKASFEVEVTLGDAAAGDVLVFTAEVSSWASDPDLENNLATATTRVVDDTGGKPPKPPKPPKG